MAIALVDAAGNPIKDAAPVKGDVSSTTASDNDSSAQKASFSSSEEVKAKAAAAAEQLKSYYEKCKNFGKPGAPEYNEVHDRSLWLPELGAAFSIWLITFFSFVGAIGGGPKDWASLLISFFVAGVFLIGGPLGALLDKKLCYKHEIALLKCDKAGQMALTWVFMWCAFQFGVTTVFGLITDSIQAAFYIGPILLICIPGLILYAPSQKPNNPGFRDAFHVLLQKKHKRRFNPNTGAPRESRMKFLWKNKTRIGHGLITDLLLLGMVRPARGPIFVRCAVVHLLFDLCLELLAASWFILRLFSVSIILSLCGGVKACAMQTYYCFMQRKRLSGLDYPAFDPPHIQALKVALQLRLKLDFGIDIPDLPSLPLPKLSLPDLKLLLPDLPDLPGIDLPKLELAFPDFDIDVPNVDFPSFQLPDLEMPELGLGEICGLMTEVVEEVLGAVLSLVFLIGEISLLVDETILEKEERDGEGKEAADETKAETVGLEEAESEKQQDPEKQECEDQAEVAQVEVGQVQVEVGPDPVEAAAEQVEMEIEMVDVVHDDVVHGAGGADVESAEGVDVEKVEVDNEPVKQEGDK